ncbi:MvaI/BcnI family restriction endonuclease [Entomomonas asaccharolytica]|uniref:MvaI/BcnI restriction endonuclease family protein n=1 Tax=Entomomonas asaccharolytica TaxID=2785331 RepID=A0A974RX14_9GAMM|nr:MvaI/BcnI family restriction endonuclease [Entomomonas asaccharolytica]QQP85743.1 MvaI/BcnI restriction endonuclease family protein [Entomomonas asaccharolytica]
MWTTIENANLQAFINDFNKVRNLGFIPCTRLGSTAIGKTFEDALKIAENNKKDPDLHGFEIKAQRHLTSSYVTLCTKSPTNPPKANQILKDEYGYPDASHPDINVLHTSIFCGKTNRLPSNYCFTLEIDELNEQLYIVITNPEGIINKSIYYTFTAIQNALSKINNLAYVQAETEIRNGQEFFHFKNATIFSQMKDFHVFIDMMKQGKIMYDIRLGAYKTGPKIGKAHDHGSGFRIKKENFGQLYNYSQTI